MPLSIFVAKNHNGDWAWAKAIVGGNRYGGEARALQVYDDGSVYITGTFRSNITLGSIKLSTMSDVLVVQQWFSKFTGRFCRQTQ